MWVLKILSSLSGHLKCGECVGEAMGERKWEAEMGSGDQDSDTQCLWGDPERALSHRCVPQ